MLRKTKNIKENWKNANFKSDVEETVSDSYVF